MLGNVIDNLIDPGTGVNAGNAGSGDIKFD